MNGEEHQDRSNGLVDAKEQQPSKLDTRPDDVESRLRRDMARFQEQARSAEADRDAAIASMRAESDARLIRAELKVAAIKSGIIDVDALRLIDTEGLTIGTDGSIEGADHAIAALRTSKPYLFADGRPNIQATFTTSQPRRPPAPIQPDPVDARTLSREQWQAERAKVLSRLR